MAAIEAEPDVPVHFVDGHPVGLIRAIARRWARGLCLHRSRPVRGSESLPPFVAALRPA